MTQEDVKRITTRLRTRADCYEIAHGDALLMQEAADSMWSLWYRMEAAESKLRAANSTAASHQE